MLSLVSSLRASFVCTALTALLAASASADGPVGNWTISEAKLVDGSTYTGSVRIAASSKGKGFDLAWKTSAGEYTGLGLAQGKLLACGWGEPGQYGVVLYQVKKDGALDGTWGQPGGGWGREVAKGGTAGRVEGAYTLDGTNPDGSKYAGKLVVAKAGETYQLSWAVAGSSYEGVGLLYGEWLAVAWGRPGASGVVAYTFDGDAAKGQFALPGSPGVGVENLKRAAR